MPANQDLRVSMGGETGRVERDQQARGSVDKRRKPKHRLQKQPKDRLGGKEVDQKRHMG